jgi:hypothetical protein
MKLSQKNIILAGIITVVVIIAGVALYRGTSSGLQGVSEKQDIAAIVQAFGKKLQLVPLGSPSSTIIQAVKDNYGPFISAGLLTGWEESPESAPGRMTSSPWPDRIEILSIDPNTDGSYDVQGNVIEVTSVEAAKGGAADTYQVAMKFRRQEDGKWLMTGFSKALPHGE